MPRYPGISGYWLGLAFKRGSLASLEDNCIMLFTGGSHVHCEIILGNGSDGRAFASYRGVGGFVNSQYPSHDQDEWELWYTPLINHVIAWDAVEKTKEASLPYNLSGQWRCVFRTFNTGNDLNCIEPREWDRGVFCSQMCLLMLRRLIHSQAIVLSPRQTWVVQSTLSASCSPNDLRAIIEPCFVRVY